MARTSHFTLLKPEIMQPDAKEHRGERGNSIMELVMISSVLLPLMLAVMDCGLYTYAFISVENGSRAAAARNSTGLESATDQATACSIVLTEMKGLPNINSLNPADCSSSPLEVTSVLCDQNTPCSGSTTSVDGQPATAVMVRYTIPSVFRIPLSGPGIITRICQMKIRNVS